MNDFILDNTMLSDFDTCPTRYYWRHIRSLVLVDDNRAPLDFGTAMHSALEAFYQSGDMKSAFTAFVLAMKNAATDDTRSLENGIKILYEYFEKWNPEPFQVVQVETAIQWELSRDLIFCGKIDLIIKWNNQIHIVDHKTSAQINNFCPKPNHQFTGYIFGAKVLGHNPVGAMINLVAVLSPNTKIPLMDRFHRVLTTRTEFELNDWKHHVLSVQQRIIQAIDSNYFEKCTTQCTWCPYKKLCTSSPETIEQVIPMYYHEMKWHPWEIEK